MPDLVVPALGESITEAVISRWHKKIGDRVEADEPVVALETDKITVELPAPAAGALTEQRFAEGDTVKVGDVVGTIGAGEAAKEKSEAKPEEQPEATSEAEAEEQPEAKAKAKPEPKAEAKPEPKKAEAKPEPKKAEATSEGKAEAKSEPKKAEAKPEAKKAEPAPEARKAEPTRGEGGNGRPLTPSMRRRRLEGEPVRETTPPPGGVASPPTPAATPARAPAPAPAPAPTGSTSADGREELVPMSPIRKRIAQRLVEAQKSTASLTTFNEVDMGAVMELRERFKQEFVDKHGVKLGFMSFFTKAAVSALKLFPGLNAEVKGDAIVYKKHYDLGVAVSTDRGLVVPVLRDVDRLSFAGIEQGINELAARARGGKLTLEDLVGGTFTITNGGIYGSMLSTPLLNYPQTGILGMHNIVERPMGVNGKVELRPIMYLALTYDHRVVDGREAVSFLVAIKQRIEQPDRLMFEL
jgi:2-oxoglutarate dehydrogenase E2 component (dihydrolipoamide succinyltransferase)